MRCPFCKEFCLTEYFTLFDKPIKVHSCKDCLWQRCVGETGRVIALPADKAVHLKPTIEKEIDRTKWSLVEIN